MKVKTIKTLGKKKTQYILVILDEFLRCDTKSNKKKIGKLDFIKI